MISVLNLVKSVGRELVNNSGDIATDLIKRLGEKIEMNNNTSKNYTIDRFEGDYAVCEDRINKKMINIKKDELPKDAKEGNILQYKNGKYEINIDEQKDVQERIKQKMNNLWNN